MVGNEASKVETRDDFLRFLKLLAEESAVASERWENRDLPCYLEALAGFAADMGGYRDADASLDTSVATWKLFAKMLAAATVYE